MKLLSGVILFIDIFIPVRKTEIISLMGVNKNIGKYQHFFIWKCEHIGFSTLEI